MKKQTFAVSFIFLLSLVACISTKPNGEKFSYQQIIIGSGPAGLTAGIYTARANFETLIIEGEMPGGLLTETPSVENWPGEQSIGGYDLMEKMREHAKHVGSTLLFDSVTSVDFSKTPYKIFTREGKTYTAQSVIIATGAARKKLGCPGEKEYWGKGVSGCATCDAPLYRDKTVVVVGGGNSALVEAHHLSRFAKKVTIVHTSSQFRVNDPIKDKVLSTPNINIIHSCYVDKIEGNGSSVTGIVLRDKETNRQQTLATDGVFVSVGFEPNTDIFKGQIDLDDRGYIKVSGSTRTSKPGVFTAGDVSHQRYQQAIVAAGDGCRAALDSIVYLDLHAGK
ncbi:thioredoxin-disulfide reductase [Candidatus Babeliales bacterium]|nr:thioredoxin-disulfide reductase [Candidatus Babeliales bacterium]